MINGFRLKISTQELKQHCMDRASYHSKRVEEYRTELPKVKEAMEALRKQGIDPTTVSQMNKSSYRDSDPVQDMQNKIKEHAQKSLVFKFFADHLFEDDYNLEENDLVRLEILKRN